MVDCLKNNGCADRHIKNIGVRIEGIGDNAFFERVATDRRQTELQSFGFDTIVAQIENEQTTQNRDTTQYGFKMSQSV